MTGIHERRKPCQLHCWSDVAESLSSTETLWQLPKRLKRIVKRRLRFLLNFMAELSGSRKRKAHTLSNVSSAESLNPGDVVRVRSREEIQSTLDRWDRLHGCSFMEEMWEYCGTKQHVFKRVQRFLDERDYLVKKCKGTVLLQDVFCKGTVDFGRCDRSCLLFWREEWLEKLGE